VPFTLLSDANPQRRPHGIAAVPCYGEFPRSERTEEIRFKFLMVRFCVPREHEEGRFIAVQWQTEKVRVFLRDLEDCALPEQTVGSL
jgi:hypothetical protein